MVADREALEPARLRPILKPGTPEWVLALAPMTLGNVSKATLATTWALVVAPIVIAIPMFLLSSPFPMIGGGVLVLSLVAMIIATFAGFRRVEPNIVSAPDYVFRGVPIRGDSFDLLADIQSRFRWAERMFGQVPAGIRWDEVDESVAELMWEAAEFAAKVSAVDVELSNLNYAAPGSPQDALRVELQGRRDHLWSRLLEIQREADDLAREASNAAAAARIALARTGSVFDLEMLAPSAANLVASGTLAAARARLALLAEVWSELDETGAIADARFEAQRQLDAGD